MGTVKKYRTPGGREGYVARDSWTDAGTGERRWRKRSFPARPGQNLTQAKREAEAWLAKRESDRAQGIVWEPTRETLGSLLDRWADDLGAPLSAQSIYMYQSCVRTRFDSRARGLRVGSMTTADVRRLVSEWERAGYAATTIDMALNVLKRAISMAIDERGILADPTAGVSRTKRAAFVPDVWSPADVTRFLEQTRDEPDGYIWELMFASLVRIGELCALRWEDLNGDLLTVRRTWSKNRIESRTKSGVARVVPLPAHVVKRLNAVRQMREGSDGGWIVARGDQALSPVTLRTRWHRAIKHHAAPPLTPHGARHSGATNMIAAGVPVPVVQRILGHTDPAMTMRRYVHPGDDDKADAVEVLAGLYRGDFDLQRARTVPKVVPFREKPE